MIQEGHVIQFKFPHTDLVAGKLHPVLIFRSIPDSNETRDLSEEYTLLRPYFLTSHGTQEDPLRHQ